MQRSPTYFIPARNANDLADTLRQLEVDESWIHEIVRRKILFDQSVFTRRSFEEPEKVREELLGGVRAYLGPDYDIARDFTPSYRPWRQRIAFVPDGDLFRGIRSGKASVVTGEIDRFTETGIRLTSGEELPADIIVTATGFDLCILGDIRFEIDGKPLDFADTVTWRGMMFTGVPNMVWVFGYFRASWTLRADLVGEGRGELGASEYLACVHGVVAVDPAFIARQIEVHRAGFSRQRMREGHVDVLGNAPGLQDALGPLGDRPHDGHLVDFLEGADAVLAHGAGSAQRHHRRSGIAPREGRRVDQRRQRDADAAQGVITSRVVV